MSGAITVKAMVVLLDARRDRQLVTRASDPTKGEEFHRLVGGHVEFGERAADAARREVYEELGQDLGDLELLGVVENLFEFDGVPGHEVVFVYRADATRIPMPDKGVWSAEDDGTPLFVEWRPLRGDGLIPLYPDGIEALLG